MTASEPNHSSQKPAARRYWWVWIALALVLAVSLFVGAQIQRRAREAAFQQAVQALGGSGLFDIFNQQAMRLTWWDRCRYYWGLYVRGGKGLGLTRILHLKGLSVTDDWVLHYKNDLRRIPGLWVTFDRCDITSDALAGLENAPWICRLTLEFVDVGDDGIAVLPTWRRLSGLELLWTKVTDAGLDVLPRCPELSHLSLDGKLITPRSVESLSRCGKLERLTIRNATDDAARALAGLTRPLMVELVGSQVTDESVPALAGLNVKVLALISTAISDEGIATIQAAGVRVAQRRR